MLLKHDVLHLFVVLALTVNELKLLEIPVDFAPTKLRQGHGEMVIAVLTALAKRALEQQQFEFKKPSFKDDG
jgi:hypothetical protein